MPTVGWIRESDLEAFYAGTERIPDPTGPRGPTYCCPFCSSTFPSSRDLQDHTSKQHYVERPLLLLAGIEPPESITVRAPFVPNDIITANASSATLRLAGASATEISIVKISEVLASMRSQELSLDLINATQSNAVPARSTYRFSFRIADKATLNSVEKAFTEHLVTQPLSRETISRFLDDPRTAHAGRDYAVGFANYCLGILLKERPENEGLTTPLKRYREMYGSALEVLKDFRRPLAELITAIIRFSLNDFSAAGRVTGYRELDLASELLADPNTVRSPSTPDDLKRRPVCPVDHGTGRILEMAARLADQSRWSPLLDEECRIFASSDLMDVGDHQKVFAIWAASAWRLDAVKSSIEPLSQIAAIYPFSRWAGEYMEKATA